MGIFELLHIGDELREMILSRKSAGDIQEAARENGLKLMREDGWAKVLKGYTTVEEVMRVTKIDVAALDLIRDRECVIINQATTAVFHTWTHPSKASLDIDQVGTQTSNLILNSSFGAGADGNHDDHCSDADDDAQHGQQRPNFILQQR